MNRQLVFVHGRSQHNKDAAALKKEWIDAWAAGLRKSGLKLPVEPEDIRFPYYGDTLKQLVDGKAPDDVVVEAAFQDDEQREFTEAILTDLAAELVARRDIPPGERVVLEGWLLNSEWFQNLLELIDKHVPFASGASIALFTNDVYRYLMDESVQKVIDDGVSKAITPGVPTVVVGHSLGSVVACKLLLERAGAGGWTVPLFATVGSPLAIKKIRTTLSTGNLRPRVPDGVKAWFNAMDERDVVALFPLDSTHFPLSPTRPAITNWRDVDNLSPNRHGIGGYLSDKEVARRIYDALTKP